MQRNKEAAGQSRAELETRGITEIKLVVIGERGCRKIPMLIVFAKGEFPKIPTIFEKYSAPFHISDKQVHTNLWDTAGKEDYDRLSPLSYNGVHAIIKCYDVTNPTSFNNFLSKGEALAQNLHAVAYFECSAHYHENSVDIFTEASRAALSKIKTAQAETQKDPVSLADHPL